MLYFIFIGAACITVGGNVQNKPCIFPFTYRDTNFTTCTWTLSDNYGRNNQPWCPTAVDELGNYEDNGGEGAEGQCGEQGCSFPIGMSYYSKQK